MSIIDLAELEYHERRLYALRRLLHALEISLLLQAEIEIVSARLGPAHQPLGTLAENP